MALQNNRKTKKLIIKSNSKRQKEKTQNKTKQLKGDKAETKKQSGKKRIKP